MTGTPAWQTLGAVAPKSLTEARLQAHYAVQAIARLAQTLLEPAGDDSHTNLGWDHHHGALVSHAFEDGRRIGLRVADLTLLALSGGEVDSMVALEGKTIFDAAEGTAGLVGFRAGAEGKMLSDMPYTDMPEHPVASGAAFDAAGNAEALAELARWFANADLVLREAVVKMHDLKPDPESVRTWPHHFDIGTLVMLDDGDPEEVRSIGLGLSPGDGSYGEPYFYVTPWPKFDPAPVADIPSPGHWRTEGFFGAIADGTAVVAEEDQRGGASRYLDWSIRAGREQLGA